MRYIIIILSSIFAMLIAAVAIWVGLVIVLASALITPFAAWWLNRKAIIKRTSVTSTQSNNGSTTSYKVIEAKYEIIEK